MVDAVRVRREFETLYQSAPRLFLALGRVNLIGEHTDYNDGFVMPAAIDLSTWVTVLPLEQRKLQIFSEHFNEEIEVDLNDQSLTRRGHWSDYAVGVAVMLEKAGHHLHGATLHIRSEVPLGSAAPLRRRIGHRRSHVSLALETGQRGIERADGDFGRNGGSDFGQRIDPTLVAAFATQCSGAFLAAARPFGPIHRHGVRGSLCQSLGHADPARSCSLGTPL